MTDRHIVAMGGGGLSPDHPGLLDFALSLTDEARPRVCFVPLDQWPGRRERPPAVRPDDL
jgi:hypothetical protein